MYFFFFLFLFYVCNWQQFLFINAPSSWTHHRYCMISLWHNTITIKTHDLWATNKPKHKSQLGWCCWRMGNNCDNPLKICVPCECVCLEIIRSQTFCWYVKQTTIWRWCQANVQYVWSNRRVHDIEGTRRSQQRWVPLPTFYYYARLSFGYSIRYLIENFI